MKDDSQGAARSNPPSSVPIRFDGARFSLTDGLVIVLAFALTMWLRRIDHELWWIVPMVAGHFFLFCNVFLVWRQLEFIWAGVFVINVALHLALGCLDWWGPCLWQLPVTIAVIVLQMRSPWYHGVWARRINPHLEDYLQHKL